MATTSSFRDHGPNIETLAVAMARGSLSLAMALKYGTEVARLLHELHQQDRAHGKVVAANVALRPEGLELLPAKNFWTQAGPEADVKAFGTLLFEMVTGTKLPSNVPASAFRIAATPSGPAGIRAAAVRLAGKCLGHLPVTLNMQQVATEIRLLWVVARQLEAAGAQDEPVAPFLVSPPAPVRTPRKPQVIPRPTVAPHAPLSGEETSGENAEPVVPLVAGDFGKPAPKTVALEPAGGHCPKCDCATVHVSRARSRFELMLTRWRIPICRCHRCYHRYVVVARMRIAKEMPQGTQRRFKPKRRH